MNDLETAAEEAADQAAFDSGYTEAPPKTPAKTEVKADEKPAPKTEASDKTLATTESAAATPEYVQLTKQDHEELKSAAMKMAKHDEQLAKAFGTIGQLQQAVNRKAAAEKTADATVETGEKGTKESAPEAEDAISKRVSDELTRREMEALDEAHEDWRTVIGLPDKDGNTPETDFRKWLATQPAEYQTKVNSTFSSVVITKAIDKFKAANTTTAKIEPKTDPKIAVRQARINGAIQPKGDGNPSPPAKTADDDFNDGFSSG